MTSPSERLAKLGLELPKVAAPLAAYVPAVRTERTVYTSGQLPTLEGKLAVTGKLGYQVSIEDAAAAARTAALNALAAAAELAGGLDRIARVLKLVVFVASTHDFTAQPQVANGASELVQQLFGEAGLHARSAVGVTVLPLDAPVEVEMIVELA